MGFRKKIVKRVIDRTMNKKNGYEEKRITIYIAIILIVLLAIIFSIDIKNAYGIGIINDEFGYWGIAASIAGKNWKELLSTTPYYSYGYSVLVSGLYYLFKNPVTIYRTALCLNVGMMLISFCFTYKCGRKIFANISSVEMLLISFAISVYSNNLIQAKIAWTETILYLLYWVTFYLFIKIVMDTKDRYIIMFAIANVCMYFVHQRTLGIVIASVILMYILMLTKKINKKQCVVFIAIFLVAIVGGEAIKKYFVNELFTSKELISMNDYSGQLSKMNGILKSGKGFLLLIESVLGKFFYLGAATFLIGYISLFELGKQTVIGGIQCVKNKLKNINDKTAIASFLFLSFMATFMIAAISMYQPEGRLDLLIYGRYMEFAIGPLLLVGLVIILEGQMKLFCSVECIVIIFMLAILVNRVYIKLGTNIYNGVCISTLVNFFDNMRQTNGVSYWIAVSTSIILVIVAIGVRTCGRGKKNRIWKSFSVILFAVLWLKQGDYTGVKNLQKSIQSSIGKITENVKKYGDGYDIYVINNSSEANIEAKYLQYYLPDMEIKTVTEFDEEKDIGDDAIYIAITDTIKRPVNSLVLEKEKNIMVFTSKKNKELVQYW